MAGDALDRTFAGLADLHAQVEPFDFDEFWAEHRSQDSRRGLADTEAEGGSPDVYVQPNRERGGWDVVREGRGRTSVHTQTQKEAIDRASEIVSNLGSGEIRLRGRDGRIRDSDSVDGLMDHDSHVRHREQ